MLGERRVTEEIALAPGREHEVVVGDGSAIGAQDSVLHVDTQHLGLPELDVAQGPNQLAHRARDLARIQER